MISADSDSGLTETRSRGDADRPRRIENTEEQNLEKCYFVICKKLIYFNDKFWNSLDRNALVTRPG